MKKSAQSVQAALSAAGLECEVKELPASTRTASEAAAAIGCSVPEIAKSIIFKAADSGRAILVIAAGHNRVEESTIAGILGETLTKASAEFVRDASGYAIGGVPPIGHKNRLETFIDRDLLTLDCVWAAAGTPNSVFCILPAQLVQITQGRVADVAETRQD